MDMDLSPKRILSFLLFTVIFLIAFSMLGQIYIYFLGGHNRYLVHLFNLDEEYNIPTWYQSMTLLFCSGLLHIIYVSKKKSNDKFYFNWHLLGIIFFLMSLDELLQFHEQISTPLNSILHTHGYLHFSWVIPAMIFLIILGIYMIKFFFNLPVKYRKLFAIAGIIYVLGAVGFEVIGGEIREIYHSQNTFTYAIMTNVEETFEMTGILIFIYSLMNYITVNLGELKVKFIDKKNL